MKRMIAGMTALFLALAGCGAGALFEAGGTSQAGALSGAAPDGEPLSVVCTIFPQYDWVRQIAGERAANLEMKLLIGSGIDLHSYQPSIEDIADISTCDLFIYVGGESDMWVADALSQAQNPDMVVINLVEALGDDVKLEEIVAGMQEEEGHSHGGEEDHAHEGEEDHAHEGEDDHALEGEEDHAHEGEEDHAHEGEEDHALEGEEDHAHEGEEVFDEHVWLSLRNAQTLCGIIADALGTLDTEGADEFKANAGAYAEKLQALDARYGEATGAASVKTLLFGDRFPFRYLVDDYGLDYHAAFPGCSAETEASFETIVFLAEKVDELALANVMVTESADQSIAETIIANTQAKNASICVLDAMQSVTEDDVAAGASYLTLMERNLQVLQEVLA